MMAEGRTRLQSEAALQARLSEATRAEGQLQARMEEAIASEERLHARLGLAQEAAQSAQTTIDAKLDDMRQLVLEADEDAKAEHEALLIKYNAAVDSETAIAGQFNIEIREYKAANQ